LIFQDREKNYPPMDIVEKEILEEPIMVPPDSLLYTVLDPHDPPSTSHSGPTTACAKDGVTCIIQEDILVADFPIDPPLPSLALV
jgi:hypothetical protein